MSADEHFLDLDDAELINTRYFALAQRNVDDVVRHGAISLFHGPPGTGKTTALAAACRRTNGRRIVLDGNPNPTVIVNELLRAVTGVAHRETRFRGAALLGELLAEGDRRKPLFIDELHLSRSVENIEFLRRIHERARVPMILAGGHGVSARLHRSPQIVRRIYSPTRFRALPERDVAKAIPAFHPIYREADTTLLLEIDRRAAHGNLGNWAKLTLDGRDECERAGARTITSEIADRVIRRQDGWLA